VLQCVAVCCSVLQCAAVCCSVLQCAAVCCSVLQCGAACCSVCSVLQCGETMCSLRARNVFCPFHIHSISANKRKNQLALCAYRNSKDFPLFMYIEKEHNQGKEKHESDCSTCMQGGENP